MPRTEAFLFDMRGATIFAGINFCYGYWQLSLAEKCQQPFTFMTCHGAVQPIRTTQGRCNSGQNIQANIEPCFVDLRHRLLALIDDVLLYSKTEDAQLDFLKRFFVICVLQNLAMSSVKSDFFAKSIQWCGCIIDCDSQRLQPSTYSTFMGLSLPKTGSELRQFVFCATRMAFAIPRLAERIAPLCSLLELAYAEKKKRTKRVVARIQLRLLGLAEHHTRAFHEIQEQVKQAVTTARRDPAQTLCLYSDDKNRFYSIVATQCVPGDLERSLAK